MPFILRNNAISNDDRVRETKQDKSSTYMIVSEKLHHDVDLNLFIVNQSPQEFLHLKEQ